MQESTARTSGTRRVYGGLYSDPAAAERGIRRFRDSGYESERIGIISRDRDEAKDVAENTGASAAAGAATGAVAGGLLGGLTGLLVGIGALAIPGIGPVVGAGALAAMLGGTAVGVSVGALGGALVALGVREEEANWCEHELGRGGTLVAIEANERDAQARNLLQRAGAYDYETRGAHPL